MKQKKHLGGGGGKNSRDSYLLLGFFSAGPMGASCSKE
jgi:hypothetical protein